MNALSDYQYFTTLLQELNSSLAHYSQETGCLFLDEVYDAVSDPGRSCSLRSRLTRDGAHFNYEGYEVLGNAMCEALGSEIDKGDVVLLVGDSITAGFPNYEPFLMGEHTGDEKHSFGYYLRTKLGCTAINRGISGDVTSNMARRIRDHLDTGPKFVILQGGANDAFSTLDFGWSQRSEEQARSAAGEIFENFRAMIELCLEQGCRVAVVPLLPFFG